MAAQWTAEVVGKMHLNNISIKALAAQLGYSHEYTGKVLSGKRMPKKAECQFKQALDELITKNHR